MPSPSDQPLSPRSSVSSFMDSSDSEHCCFLRALIAGKEEAWTEFYQRYAHRLRAYLQTAWQGSPDHLDDLLQETLLRAVKYLKPFPTEEALWSWLTVLARSTIADHGRKQSRFRRYLQLFHLEPRSAPTSSPEPLTQALSRLNEEEQHLLQLKYDEARSTREIAQLLSLTEKAVERRLARTRKKLRKILTTLTTK